MSYIEGFNRKQAVLFPKTIDEIIDSKNAVRFIDQFVDKLDIAKLGFKDVRKNVNGRPPYHPSDLLKLYIYGYMNKIRSSRGLEKECKRNIELMWLMKGLIPDHNTIANFRKDNSKSIKKVFRATVSLAQNRALIGGILLAGDGTRLRAQNSKKNNFNERKIAQHLEYIDQKLEEYTQALSKADGDSEDKIKRKISKQLRQKHKYEGIREKLRTSGEKQISTSDPDARQIMIRGMISEVAYNIQSTVDHKYKLPIDYKVTNENDKNALGNMVRRARSIVRNHHFSVLYDKGYYNAREMAICHNLGIETHIAIPKPAATAPNPAFNLDQMIYNHENDTYTCPAQQTLETNGRWYQKSRSRVKQYKTKHCKHCELKPQCSISKTGRIIERHEYAAALERNHKALRENPQVYYQRQSIVEHPFGTMKRQWGFDHIMTKKTINHASADVGFIFIAYNLTRIINILSIDELLELFRGIYMLIDHKKVSHKANLLPKDTFLFFTRKIAFLP